MSSRFASACRAVALLIPALLATGSLPASAADNVWVGNDSLNTGNFSYSGNWQNNTLPTWSSTNSLVFTQNQNSNVTGLVYDLSGWNAVDDIKWAATFPVARTLSSSNGNGIDFKVRMENLSSFTQTVTLNSSGGKFSANEIQLNPVNGSLILSGTIYNDNNVDYVVWGSTSSTTTNLTLNTALGPNASAQANVDFTVSGGRNSNVQVNASQLWSGTTTVNSGSFTTANGVTLASTAIVVGGGTVATTSANTLADAAALTVNSGRLSIGGSDTVASLAGSGGTVDIASGATLTAGNAGSTSYAGSITGSGGFTKVGSGTFTLSAASSYTGTTTVSAGQFSLGGANLLSDSSAVTGSAGAVFALGGNETIGSLAGSLDVALGSSTLTAGGNGQSTTFSGGLTGSGGLTKSGSGTLTLAGSNSYSGGTTVSGGRLVGTTANLQGAITNNAAVEFAQATSGTYAGTMSGSGALTMAGTGTTTLTGINTYTGLTTVDAGTLILKAGVFGTGILPGNAAVNNGGTLQIFAQAQSGIAPTTNTTIVTVNGGGTLAFTGAGANQDDMAYLGTVTLSNTGGSGAVANSPDGSGIRFGNNGRNGTVNSYGTTTNTFGANIVLVNNGGGTTMTFNTGTSNALVVSGGIADYTGLTGTPVVISGSGTTTLSGTSTYAGTTTITNSTLVVSGLLGGGNYGAGITNNGSLVFSNPGNQTLSGVVSGSGTLTKAGPGTVTLSQANSSTGGTLVSQGTLVGNASTSFGSGAIVLGNGNTGTSSIVLVADTTASTTIANDITVANLGTGVVSIGGTNTGASSANAWTGTLTLNRNVQVFNDTPHAGGRTSFIGQITGSGGITVTQGRGRVTLQNTTNNFTGPVVVDSGATLQLDVATNTNEVIPNSAAVTVNGALNFASGGGTETIGSLAGSGTVSSGVAGTYSLAVGGSTSTTFSGVINNGSGVIGLTKSGAGTLTLTGSSGFTGGAVLNAGTLAVGSANALGSSGTISFGGGTLQYSASNTTDYSGRFSNAASQQYSIDTNGQNVTLGSSLTSSGGSFTKLGAGDVTLSGTNSYGGGTVVSAGRLVGTTTSLQGAITNNAAVEFAQATSGTYAGSMTGSGSLTKTGTGTMTLSGSNSYGGGSIVSAGRLVGTTTSLQGAITNNAAVEFAQATSGTYAGSMTGSGSLTKTGTGTVTLSGSNSYAGGSIVSAGRLVGNTASLQGAITNNAEVEFAQSTSGTYAGSMTGSGSLTKSNAGVLTLTGSSGFTGGAVLNAGTLAVGSANAFGSSGTISFGGGTLQYSASNTTDYSGRFSNVASQQYSIDTNGQNVTLGSNLTSSGGSFTKLGSGSATLSGNNSYTGGTVVSAGRLIGTTASLQGAITNDAAVTFDMATSGTYAGRMDGSGSLTKTGAGTLTLSNTTVYTGPTALNGGVIALASINALQATGTITFGGGTLQYSANNTLDYSDRFSTAPGQQYRIDTNGQNVSFMRSLTSAGGSLVKLGDGNLQFSGTNSYSGGTTVSGGSLVGTTASIQGNIVNNANVYFFTNASGTYAGIMSGTGSLTAYGTASIALTAANTYTGPTTISRGGLQLNGSIAGSLSVESMASLSGTGTIGGNATIAGTHSPGNSPGAQTFTGDLTYQSGAVVNWELIANTTGSAGVNYDQIIVPTGNLTFSGSTTLALSFNGPGSTVDWSDSFWNVNRAWTVYDLSAGSTSSLSNLIVGGSLLDSANKPLSPTERGYFTTSLSGQDVMLNFVAVPEPSTWAMALTGLACGGWIVRRRRLSRAPCL